MINQLGNGYILIFFRFVPLVFLIYTLLNLEKLKIPVTHPRVIVELVIFLVLIISGILIEVLGLF